MEETITVGIVRLSPTLVPVFIDVSVVPLRLLEVMRLGPVPVTWNKPDVVMAATSDEVDRVMGESVKTVVSKVDEEDGGLTVEGIPVVGFESPLPPPPPPPSTPPPSPPSLPRPPLPFLPPLPRPCSVVHKNTTRYSKEVN